MPMRLGLAKQHPSRWLAALVGLTTGAVWLLQRRRDRHALTGEVAVVTGGSRGLGRLIAEELSRQGCRIVVCARDRT
jgi:5,10-methylene-tetrahydrofolate dehydrogenase/methenyl tetrahydrofolate cyclohydrolase